jgi:hypothetical protein
MSQYVRHLRLTTANRTSESWQNFALNVFRIVYKTIRQLIVQFY